MKFFALSMIAYLALASANFAGSVELKLKLSPIGSFTAKSSDIVGSVAIQPGQPTNLSGTFSLDIKSLKTGISLRDNHMHDRYFEVAKFAKAEGKILSAKDGQFTGELTIRDITKPVTGTYQVDGAKVTLEFETKYSDFNIEKPSYLGVSLVDAVQVVATLESAEAKK